MTNNLNTSDAASGGGKSDLENAIIKCDCTIGKDCKFFPGKWFTPCYISGFNPSTEIQRLKEEIKRLTPDPVNDNPSSFDFVKH